MAVGNATSGRISQASSLPPRFCERHSPYWLVLPRVRPRTPHAQSPPAAGWAPPPHQAHFERCCGGWVGGDKAAMHCLDEGTSARSRSAAWMNHGLNTALLDLKPGKPRAGGCQCHCCAQVWRISQPLRRNAASLRAWSSAGGWLQCIHSVSTLQDSIATQQGHLRKSSLPVRYPPQPYAMNAMMPPPNMYPGSLDCVYVLRCAHLNQGCLPCRCFLECLPCLRCLSALVGTDTGVSSDMAPLSSIRHKLAGFARLCEDFGRERCIEADSIEECREPQRLPSGWEL